MNVNINKQTIALFIIILIQSQRRAFFLKESDITKRLGMNMRLICVFIKTNSLLMI